MVKQKDKTYSRYSREAAELIGTLIHNARIDRNMTVVEVAERAGISRGLVYRIEKGDPSCTIGATFEVAALLGVPLFESDPTTLTKHLASQREKLRLLPKAVRASKTAVDDDF